MQPCLFHLVKIGLGMEEAGRKMVYPPVFCITRIISCSLVRREKGPIVERHQTEVMIVFDSTNQQSLLLDELEDIVVF